MKAIWRKHPILAGAFALAMIVAVFLGIRAIAAFVYWNDPALSGQPVAGWMTPRYVVHAYDLPPDVVGGILGVAPQEVKRRTLTEIAEVSGKPVSQVIEELEAAIAARRASQ